MNSFEIKDSCRKNLTKYTLKAFSIIPEFEKPDILDAGCGTGEPSLALIEKCNGVIYAVDPDRSSLNRFEEKVRALNLNDRIKIFNDTIFNPALFHFKFDIVLAEGVLNVLGFERGLPILIRNLKESGYLIIHDELKNDSEKRHRFREKKLNLLDSFILDEKVWREEYIACLEAKIKGIHDADQSKNEIIEIGEYKKNPENFRSIYYILHYGPLNYSGTNNSG